MKTYQGTNEDFKLKYEELICFFEENGYPVQRQKEYDDFLKSSEPNGYFAKRRYQKEWKKINDRHHEVYYQYSSFLDDFYDWIFYTSIDLIQWELPDFMILDHLKFISLYEKKLQPFSDVFKNNGERFSGIEVAFSIAHSLTSDNLIKTYYISPDFMLDKKDITFFTTHSLGFTHHNGNTFMDKTVAEIRFYQREYGEGKDEIYNTLMYWYLDFIGVIAFQTNEIHDILVLHSTVTDQRPESYYFNKRVNRIDNILSEMKNFNVILIDFKDKAFVEIERLKRENQEIEDFISLTEKYL